MLDNIQCENILFLDIETVSQYSDYEELPENIRIFWDYKASLIAHDDTYTPATLYDRAGIYAEFGKIVCISVGYIRDKHLRIKSFFGHDEKAILEEFADLLNKSYNKKESLLCAHNGKEFDFPYIARRMLLNGIKLPMTLNIAGCKPWDIKHLDTMELWKFGDYKSFTSLALLTTIFEIPSPKDDIQGNQVGAVYWQEGNLERIVNYCQKDVVAIVQLLKRYKGEELIADDNITVV